jgi:hypothetical protein
VVKQRQKAFEFNLCYLMFNHQIDLFTIIVSNLFVFGVTQINFIVIELMDFVIISFART